MNSKILQFSICAAGALLLSGSALAQQDAMAKIRPITTAVKDAGVYHVATGTWTRAAQDPVATLGADVLYDNTCWVGYYSGLADFEVFVDNGRAPSLTSPNSAISITGTGTSYGVDGYKTQYCTVGITGPTSLDYAWYMCYAICSDATLLTPTVAYTGLFPANGFCWTVIVDFANTTYAWTISADCNGSYDNNQSLDNFGWSIGETAPSAATTVGPIICGDFLGLLTGGPGGTGCPFGDGTVWQPGLGDGTGVGSQDAFESDLNGVLNACYYYGGYTSGNLYASFAHELIGSAAPANPGIPGCFCTLVNAPCGNNFDTAGCLNSVGTGASISATGTDFVANDNLVLHVTGSRPSKPGVWLQGGGQQQVMFKDGNLCVANPTVRIWGDVSTTATGDNDTTDLPAGGLVAQLAVKGWTVVPGTPLWYQWWYRDGGGPCLQQSNLSNNLQINWQ